MNPVELQETLQAVEPAAVLVTSGVLEKMLRQAINLPAWMWSAPHHSSWIVDRQLLFRFVEQEDLLVKPDRLLPSTVILMEMPDFRNAAEDRLLLREYWRRLFHASIDLALLNQAVDGKWPAAAVEERIARLGPTVFEEIRTVLHQENSLPPEADARAVYFEFVAVFWEMHFFARPLLDSFFPGIADLVELKKLIGQDVNAEEILTRTRLAGSADLPLDTRAGSREAHEYFDKLILESDLAAAEGNVVRGAIQRRRAARVAPAPQAYETRRQAMDALDRLLDRLQPALELTEDEMPQWRKHLPELLDKADQGTHPAEAAILFDLQTVCLDFEREIYTLDLVEWLLSGGRKPIKRPLTSQRIVRVTRHVRGIAQRLNLARLSEADRKDLAGLIQTALNRSETRVRERFRPVLFSALEDVGLRPTNPPERTAFRKMVEELLDRILEYGFLGFSDLRDAISRNQLKLPDLTDPEDFLKGDPLLRLDRRLSTLLDGVYRRGEFYLRWLERFTALNFGTQLGRLLTLYVTVPFGGAYLVLLAINHFVLAPLGVEEQPLWSMLMIWLGVGIFFLGLLHSKEVRLRCEAAGRAVVRGLRHGFIDFPFWLWRNAQVLKIVSSLPFQIGYWYLFKPLVLCGLLWLYRPDVFSTWIGRILAFLAANFLVNSRAGRAVADGVAQAFVSFLVQLRAGLIPALIRFVTELFKHILHLAEASLFAVDEWLRFRGGDSRAAMTVRVALGVIWWPIGYLLRLIMVVLIEPGLNPVKLPFSILAAKIMAPLTAYILYSEWFAGLDLYSKFMMGWFLFWLPDAPTFFFWEMKENWRLYRANRGRVLAPVPLGPHGESMRRLLQPGFHSGTVPKLFRRLRSAEKRARRTGNYSRVRSCRAALEEVEEAVRLFVSRELLVLLDQDPSWQGQLPAVGRILLATNRIQVELLLPDGAARALWLNFESLAGSLTVELRGVEALAELSAERRRALHNGLALLFKLSGVDRVVADHREVMVGEVPVSWEHVIRTFSTPPSPEGNGFLCGELSFLPAPAAPVAAAAAAAPVAPAARHASLDPDYASGGSAATSEVSRPGDSSLP